MNRRAKTTALVPTPRAAPARSDRALAPGTRRVAERQRREPGRLVMRALLLEQVTAHEPAERVCIAQGRASLAPADELVAVVAADRGLVPLRNGARDGSRE